MIYSLWSWDLLCTYSYYKYKRLRANLSQVIQYQNLVLNYNHYTSVILNLNRRFFFIKDLFLLWESSLQFYRNGPGCNTSLSFTVQYHFLHLIIQTHGCSVIVRNKKYNVKFCKLSKQMRELHASNNMLPKSVN